MRERLNTDRRVIVLGLARMSESFGNSFLLVVIPLFIASHRVSGGTFGLSEALIIGVLLSLTGLMGSLGQPIFGYISDRLRRRKVFILAGLLVLATTDLTYIIAGSYAFVLLVRSVQGVGSMLTTPTTIALINEYSDDESRGENMGVYTTLRLVGTGIGPVIAGLVIDFGPYRLPVAGEISGFDGAFVIAAIGTFLSSLLVFAFVFDPPDIKAHAYGSGPAFTVDGVGLLRDPVVHVSVGALAFGVNLGIVLAIQPQVNTRLGQGPTMFGIQLVAFGLPLVFLGPFFGAVSDRFGRRPFLLTGIGLLGPATYAQGVVTTPDGMLLARILAGLAAALAFAPAVALVGDVARKGDSGSKLSLLTMSLGVGGGISPIFAGYLVGFGYLVPFVVGALFAGVVFVAGVIVLPETLQSDVGEIAGKDGASNV